MKKSLSQQGKRAERKERKSTEEVARTAVVPDKLTRTEEQEMLGDLAMEDLGSDFGGDVQLRANDKMPLPESMTLWQEDLDKAIAERENMMADTDMPPAIKEAMMGSLESRINEDMFEVKAHEILISGKLGNLNEGEQKEILDMARTLDPEKAKYMLELAGIETEGAEEKDLLPLVTKLTRSPAMRAAMLVMLLVAVGCSSAPKTVVVKTIAAYTEEIPDTMEDVFVIKSKERPEYVNGQYQEKNVRVFLNTDLIWRQGKATLTIDKKKEILKITKPNGDGSSVVTIIKLDRGFFKTMTKEGKNIPAPGVSLEKFHELLDEIAKAVGAETPREITEREDAERGARDKRQRLVARALKDLENRSMGEAKVKRGTVTVYRNPNSADNGRLPGQKGVILLEPRDEIFIQKIYQRDPRFLIVTPKGKRGESWVIYISDLEKFF